jgi:hypothetical protein
MNCVQNEKASPTETENGVLKWRKFSNAEVIEKRSDNFSDVKGRSPIVSENKYKTLGKRIHNSEDVEAGAYGIQDRILDLIFNGTVESVFAVC